MCGYASTVIAWIPKVVNILKIVFLEYKVVNILKIVFLEYKGIGAWAE